VTKRKPARIKQDWWLERIVIGTCIAMWAFFIWWSLGGSAPTGGLP
jgi:hypothetical protein